jgi:hypothetical protein
MGSEPGEGDPSGTTSLGPVVPAAFTLPNDANGCYEAVGILLVDLAQAQKALPANWTAADASGVLEVPQSTGRGGIWFNGYTCDNSTMAMGPLGAAEFGVLVEAPRLSDNATVNATFNVYQLFHYSDSASQRSTLELVGLDPYAANVSISRSSPVANSQTGTVVVGNATGVHYSFEYATLLPDTFTGSAAFWTEAPDGLAVFRFEITDKAVLQGGARSCSFATPELQAVTGSPTCGPGQALVLVIAQQAWTSEFRWMPGVDAVAATA